MEDKVFNMLFTIFHITFKVAIGLGLTSFMGAILGFNMDGVMSIAGYSLLVAFITFIIMVIIYKEE